MSLVPKISRILSPTRSTIAWKSSWAASPSCTLLMIASSAARCSLSLNRRCVSSKRRAFSSATPMLAATVLSSRTSASPKAFSRSIVLQQRSCRARGRCRGSERSPTIALWSVPGTYRDAQGLPARRRFVMTRLAVLDDRDPRVRRAERLSAADVEALAMLVFVEVVNQIGLASRASGCRCRRS